MRHTPHLLTLIAGIVLLTACGTKRQATTQSTTVQLPTATLSTAQRLDAIVGAVGDWSTLQVGGSMNLTGGKSLSSSMQMRMVRDEAIYVSLRPMLGIEVARLLITADSIYAIDKYHKRYVAEKVSLITGGIPVTVSTVQDIFLGRPFVLGDGSLSAANRDKVRVNDRQNGFALQPQGDYEGYTYSFSYNADNQIVALEILPAGSSTAAYSVHYSDPRTTLAGQVAGAVNATAKIKQQNFSFNIDYDDFKWNTEVKIERSIPGNYKRMSSASITSLLGS